MGERLDLMVVGDVNPDLILTGDVEPTFGQGERLLDDARLTVGGSGAIMACAAARLGLGVAICGLVGDDPLGRFMHEELDRRGVSTAGLRTSSDVPTGISVILARPDDRAILTHPGTIASLTSGDVDPRLLAAARHVHVSSFYLQAALDVPGLFADAHAAGATTSIDPNADPTCSWDGGLRVALAHTDVFLPNATEALAIANATTLPAAAATLSVGGATVVIKAGRDGAVATRSGELVTAPAFPAADPVDTTGAGDCFDAAFLASWLDGASLAEALRTANACGALSTRALGGVDGQPTMDEVRGALAAGS